MICEIKLKHDDLYLKNDIFTNTVLYKVGEMIFFERYTKIKTKIME